MKLHAELGEVGSSTGEQENDTRYAALRTQDITEQHASIQIHDTNVDFRSEQF